MTNLLVRTVILALACLPLLVGASEPLGAEEAPAPQRLVNLSEATVLGSPGVPTALHSFLPRSATPQPIRVPLPPGPLLILGLPEQDPVAHDLAEGLGLLATGVDLHGGWRLHVWEDEGRPIAVLLAAHPSALFAARNQFVPVRPPRMMAGPRTLDYTAPNEEAGVALPLGTVADMPAWRHRAAFVDPASLRDVMRLVAARASHAVVPTLTPRDGAARRGLARLRAHGVEPLARSSLAQSAEPTRLACPPTRAHELPVAPKTLETTTSPRNWVLIAASDASDVMLESAWTGVADQAALAQMRALLPTQSARTKDDAERTADALEAADAETLGFHPWMRARAKALRLALTTHASLPWRHMPYVPAPLAIDGVAGDAAWRHACVPAQEGLAHALGLRLLAVDGGLALALRAPPTEGARLELKLAGREIALEAKPGGPWRVFSEGSELRRTAPYAARVATSAHGIELVLAGTWLRQQLLPGAVFTVRMSSGAADAGTEAALLIWR